MAKSAGKARRRAGRAKEPVRAGKTRVAAADPYAHEDHIDGCDIDFHAGEPTRDADLPAAVAGMHLGGQGARGRPLRASVGARPRVSRRRRAR